MVCPCTLWSACVVCQGTGELVGQHPSVPFVFNNPTDYKSAPSKWCSHNTNPSFNLWTHPTDEAPHFLANPLLLGAMICVHGKICLAWWLWGLLLRNAFLMCHGGSGSWGTTVVPWLLLRQIQHWWIFVSPSHFQLGGKLFFFMWKRQRRKHWKMKGWGDEEWPPLFNMNKWLPPNLNNCGGCERLRNTYSPVATMNDHDKNEARCCCVAVGEKSKK